MKRAYSDREVLYGLRAVRKRVEELVQRCPLYLWPGETLQQQESEIERLIAELDKHIRSLYDIPLEKQL